MGHGFSGSVFLAVVFALSFSLAFPVSSNLVCFDPIVPLSGNYLSVLAVVYVPDL